MNEKELIAEFRKRRIELKSDLEKRLEKAKPLKGRKDYRTFKCMLISLSFTFEIEKILSMPEDEKSLKRFDKTLDSILSGYFDGIVDLINSCDAWQMLDMNKEDYAKEKFDNLSREEKFKLLHYLNTKYISFLDIQQTADERDSLVQNEDSEIDEETLKRMIFLEFMFNKIGDENFRDESVFSMNEDFLSELIRYRKSKTPKLEEYVKQRKKAMQFEFEKFGTFLKEEDLLAIADAIIMSISVFKCPKKDVINFFHQMSETIFEKRFLESSLENFRNLEAKSKKMENIRIEAELSNLERIRREKALEEEKERKRLEELERRKQEELRKKEQQRRNAEFPKVNLDSQIQELEKKIALLQNMPTVKEYVIPVILLWTGIQDVSLKKKIGTKSISSLFKKLKQIEKEKGIRTSLYLITNANKDITGKRFQELMELAIKHNMPSLLEGAIGAYGSFRIDRNGKAKDRAIMSEENKEIIMQLLEHTRGFQMPRDMIDTSVEDFLRYRFSDKDDEVIDEEYLAILRSRLLKNDSIKSQPLKLFLYNENGGKGIDILLKSQADGILKVGDYYRAKYHIKKGNGIQINIETLDEFLKAKKEEEQK